MKLQLLLLLLVLRVSFILAASRPSDAPEYPCKDQKEGYRVLGGMKRRCDGPCIFLLTCYSYTKANATALKHNPPYARYDTGILSTITLPSLTYHMTSNCVYSRT